MKPQTIALLKEVCFKLFLCNILFLVFTTLTAQTALKPSVYRNFIRPNSTVKIQTVAGQKVQATDTTSVNNIQLEPHTKNVIKYESKIAALDVASLRHFQEETKSEAGKEEVKVIPELHVETNSTTEADATAYRIVFTSVQPLHYDSEKNLSGKLAFLLINESGKNDATIQPVKIEISSDEIGVIKPAALTIDHLSIPSSYVDLVGKNISDSASVKISTVSNPNGYITYLKVKPVLELFTRSKIQGWGIQEVPVTVSFSGSRSKDSVLVSFNADKGTITPSSIKMAYDQTSEVHLRSEGLGKSKITAIANSIRSDAAIVEFIFPWYFLLASILGGIAGTFIKHYSKSTRKKLSAKVFLVGIITGFIGAAAYYVLGINLLKFSLSGGLNEIAVFVISALFAYFGISITNAVSGD